MHLSWVKKNPAIQKTFIHFSIENLIANISLYASSWLKLNFGCYLTFEIIFKALFQWKNKNKKNWGLLNFFLPTINATVFNNRIFLSRYNIFFFLITYVIPLALMAVCYSRMGWHLWGKRARAALGKDLFRIGRKTSFNLISWNYTLGSLLKVT